MPIEIHNFILTHIAGVLPGLWFYSRPASLPVVLMAMVLGVVAIRFIAKLLPVLLLGAIVVLVIHHGIH